MDGVPPHMAFADILGGRFGTARSWHPPGERAWMIYQSDIVARTHASFLTGQTRYLKPVTQTIVAMQDISAVAALNLVI